MFSVPSPLFLSFDHRTCVTGFGCVVCQNKVCVCVCVCVWWGGEGWLGNLMHVKCQTHACLNDIQNIA